MLSHDASHLDYFALVREAKRIDGGAHGTKLRVALLADFSTQHLVPVLRALFARSHVNAEIYAAEFDTTEVEVLDDDSGLYAFKPDVILLFGSIAVLRNRYFERREANAGFAQDVAGHLEGLWNAIRARSKAVIVQSTYVLPYERVFGNFEHRVVDSLTSTVMAVNARILERARVAGAVLINDVDAIASYVGRKSWFDEKLWTLAKTPCALEHLPLLAQNVVDIALTTIGRSVKCVILDLDNTLWGGVIGDDGVQGIALGHFGEGEPFVRFQQYLRELKRRGIILAVCSKNEEEAALKPFREHPDMVLRETDIAVFVANWNTKVDNIKAIQEVLNIGFDSMVFLDDNPFERNMVREYLPEVVVPELPEEPSDYVRVLSELNLFETSSFTEEDRLRADLYREESARRMLEKSFTNVDEYLSSLDMRIVVARFDEFHLPRVAQLIQRSNQFNLTTRRHGQAECEAMMVDAECEPLYVQLADKFGDYGLISVVVLRFEKHVAKVDTWLMSCRVLARGVEQFTMNRAVEIARSRGARLIIGEYIPTSKNKMVKDFFSRFGFNKTQEDSGGRTTWTLELATYEARPTHLHDISLERKSGEESA